MSGQNDHPILTALENVGYEDDDNDDTVIPATGGEPWHPQASWPALVAKQDPNHMEVTSEAVKCYKLNQDEDIVRAKANIYIGEAQRQVRLLPPEKNHVLQWLRHLARFLCTTSPDTRDMTCARLARVLEEEAIREKKK